MRRGDMKERETYAKTRVHKEDSVARLPARALTLSRTLVMQLELARPTRG